LNNSKFVKQLIKVFNGKIVYEYPCKGFEIKNASRKENLSGGKENLKSPFGKRAVRKGENKNDNYLF
jgi:hypothetical protein